MQILTDETLTRCTESELAFVFHQANLALINANPLSPAWKAAHANVDAVHRIRRTRLSQRAM